MTTATATASTLQGSPLSGLDALVARARTAWTRYATYHRTLAELRSLPDALLADIDLDRAQIAARARRDVYGA